MDWARSCVPMNGPGLFDQSLRLPDEAELQHRFAHFNHELFQGKLPPAVMRWSSRMRIAGTCRRSDGLITLSRPYHLQFPGDVEDTIKHEMIHLRHAGHGPAFRRVAQRIGTTIHCKEYPGLHPRARLVYICFSCHSRYPRTKPGELYCGRCSRNWQDRRFPLRLLETLPAAGAQSRPASIAAKRSSHRLFVIDARMSAPPDLFS